MTPPANFVKVVTGTHQRIVHGIHSLDGTAAKVH